MNQLTTQELEAIRKRAEQATEGPWYINDNEYPYDKAARLVTNRHVYITKSFNGESDADFIANARTDIPKLLAEVDRLRNALKPDDTTIIATNQRLQAGLKEAESIALWSARRLPKVYKTFAYDAIDELFGGEAERL